MGREGESEAKLECNAVLGRALDEGNVGVDDLFRLDGEVEGIKLNQYISRYLV